MTLMYDDEVKIVCEEMEEAHERRVVLQQAMRLRDDWEAFICAWQYAKAIVEHRWGYEIGAGNRKRDPKRWSHHFRALVLTCADVLKDER